MRHALEPQGVSEDVELAVARRRRRLNVKLRSSLKDFKEEVLSEVGQQASQAKVRQDRLQQRRADIIQSLSGLQVASLQSTPCHPCAIPSPPQPYAP